MEHDVSLKTVTATVKQLENKSRLMEKKKKLQEKTTEKPVKMYCAQNTIVRKSVGKLVEIVLTGCVGMVM